MSRLTYFLISDSESRYNSVVVTGGPGDRGGPRPPSRPLVRPHVILLADTYVVTEMPLQSASAMTSLGGYSAPRTTLDLIWVRYGRGGTGRADKRGRGRRIKGVEKERGTAREGRKHKKREGKGNEEE